MPDYLKIPEIARRLDVSDKTVRKYITTGELPSTYMGRSYRVSEEDLKAFVESRRSKPPKAKAPLPFEEGDGGVTERRREARAGFIRVVEDLDDAGIEQLREDLPAHELGRPELWKDPRSRAEEIATRMFILELILQVRSSEATGWEREILGQLIAS